MLQTSPSHASALGASVPQASALKKGDVIGIVAPASSSRSLERIERSVRYLEGQGYRVLVGEHLMDGPGYLAAPDQVRTHEFESMIANREVKALFFIRGGYGTARLLPMLDYELIKKNPKIIVGYSDATALFCGIYKKTGLRSLFFGPMPGVDMWDTFEPFAEENFWRAVTSPQPIGELPLAPTEGEILRRSMVPVQANMLGGNLRVFTSIFGTPFMPDLNDSALFFEEIDERPYRVDRDLAQLKIAGVFDRAKAILLGQFSGCVETESSPSWTIEEVFDDYFGKLDIPVVMNLPWGHVARQWTIPFGATLSIDCSQDQAKISIVNSVLA